MRADDITDLENTETSRGPQPGLIHAPTEFFPQFRLTPIHTACTFTIMAKHNTKPTAEVVRCPRCNRPHPKRGGHDTIYGCEHCRAMFDDTPDEGGDYDNRNPAARIVREEQWKENRRAKA